MFLISENILSKFKVVVNRGNVIEMKIEKARICKLNLPTYSGLIIYIPKSFLTLCSATA